MSALIFLLATAAIFGTVLAAEAREPGGGITPRPLGLIGWLTGGNWPAKIGGGLLLVGLGALLRYALLNLDFPPSVKLGGGVAAAGLLGLGATLTRIGSGRRAVSLALGGAAFGVAYITAYSAFALFHYYDSLTGTTALALIAVATAVYAITRSALSLALLAMLGAYLAPAFATADPGPTLVYGHLAFASLLTLAMVAARGWRPLIHLSLLFTLGGGVFFAWTAKYFQPQYASSMLPMVLVLTALQALMPIVERKGAQNPWIERLDLAYLLALPALAGLAALLIAPTRVDLSNELLGLAAIWFVLAGCLAPLKREGAIVHAVIGILLAGLAVAARFRNLPWELIGLAFSVLALWVAARRSHSTRLQDALASLVPVMGLAAIVSSVVASADDAAAIHAQFLERVIGAALLMFAGHICRSIRNSLDTLLWSVGIAWLLIAVGSEVMRWHLISLPVLVHWVFLAGAAFLAATKLRPRLLPEALFAVVAGVLVTTSWAAAVSPATISWVSLAVAPLVLVWLSIRRAGADPATRTGRLLAAATAPIVAGLWAIHGGELIGIHQAQFALCAMAAAAVLIVGLSAVAYARSEDWRAAAIRIYAASFAVALALATTIAISRSEWAITLEVLSLAGLALVVWTETADAPAPRWVAPGCALGLGLALQANLLRWLGPAGALSIGDITHMRLTGLVSLLWASLGALVTIWAKQRASRALWIAGATLLVAAAVKFVLFDFGALGQLGNILAVIAAGVVFLLVGWLAPMPPASTAPTQTAVSPSPPAAARPAEEPQSAANLAAAPGAATPAAPARAAAWNPPADRRPSVEPQQATSPMSEYWQRNVSTVSRDPWSARSSDSGGRIVWIIVVLAALVLPLAQCARPRVHYSDFSGYATPGASSSPVLATTRRPQVPAPPQAMTSPQVLRLAPMEAVERTNGFASSSAPARSPEETPGAALPERGGSSTSEQPAGAYKCVQPDGSTTYSDVPCSGNAERVQLQSAPPRSSPTYAAAASSAATSSAPEILSAAYVSPRNGRSLDVTNQIKTQCVAEACTISCGNQLAGDPDFGQAKYCRISYQCSGDGTTRELRFHEGHRVRLSCALPAGATNAR
jgi:uncharacterized membrane protein